MLILFVVSQEIADGVKKSSQVVQAAGAGIQQIGSKAREQTMCTATTLLEVDLA